MYLVQKNHLRKLDKTTYQILLRLARLSKNVYNETLWYSKHYWENEHKILSYKDAWDIVKYSDYYELLPAQTAQQTMKYVNRNLWSFRKLLSKKKRGEYKKPVVFPKYKPNEGYFTCIFTPNLFKLFENKVRISLGNNIRKDTGIKYLWFDIPEFIIDKQIKEIRLVPKYYGTYFEIEFVYKAEMENRAKDYTKCLSIDLGLDNFAGCVDTDGTAFIIEGRGIKSYNRWYNKEKSKLQSIYKKQEIKFGSRLNKLYIKRYNKIRNFMAQAVNYVIKHALTNEISTVIVGKYEVDNQNGKTDKKSNQNFHHIPHNQFRTKLKAKCELYGIEYLEENEFNSSIRCSGCGVIEPKYRVHRGLFVCGSCGLVINSDINAGHNLRKKVAYESFRDWIVSSGGMIPPVRIRVIDL